MEPVLRFDRKVSQKIDQIKMSFAAELELPAGTVEMLIG